MPTLVAEAWLEGYDAATYRSERTSFLTPSTSDWFATKPSIADTLRLRL